MTQSAPGLIAQRLRAAADLLEKDLAGLSVVNVHGVDFEVPEFQIHPLTQHDEVKLIELGAYWTRWFATRDGDEEQRMLRIDNLKGFSVWGAQRRPVSGEGK